MVKIKLDKNVYEAAIERINYTFDNFESIYLSFSAGKDSTLMLHLAIEVAKQNGWSLKEKLRMQFFTFGKNLEHEKYESILIFKKDK